MMFCTVRIHVGTISCPGVRLEQGLSEIYLSIDFIDRCLYTRALKPHFPLQFDESFEIFKSFPHFADTSAINNWLKDTRVWVKLFGSNVKEGYEALLASHQTSAWDFLFPTYPKYNTYRYIGEIFLHPSQNFLGHIHPKLHISTWTCMGQLATSSKQCSLDDCAVNLSIVNRMLSCKGIICAKDFQGNYVTESKTCNAQLTKYPDPEKKSHYVQTWVSRSHNEQYTMDTKSPEQAVKKMSKGTQWEPPGCDVKTLVSSARNDGSFSNFTRINESSHLSHWRRRFGLYPAITQREAQLVHIAVDPQILKPKSQYV